MCVLGTVRPSSPVSGLSDPRGREVLIVGDVLGVPTRVPQTPSLRAPPQTSGHHLRLVTVLPGQPPVVAEASVPVIVPTLSDIEGSHVSDPPVV